MSLIFVYGQKHAKNITETIACEALWISFMTENLKGFSVDWRTSENWTSDFKTKDESCKIKSLNCIKESKLKLFSPQAKWGNLKTSDRKRFLCHEIVLLNSWSTLRSMCHQVSTPLYSPAGNLAANQKERLKLCLYCNKGWGQLVLQLDVLCLGEPERIKRHEQWP